jgi:signal transduction histidine kinase
MTIFRALVHPEDRESVQKTVDVMMRGEDARVEYRIMPSSGATRWVVSRGNRHVFPVDNRPLLMGITFDSTERRNNEEALRTLSSRLINAQEEERKRIARELHDGISQQVAMIASGIQQFRSSNDLPPNERSEWLGNLNNATMQLASDIQALSHELHSSSLDYLGLTTTLQGLCREISQHQQVEVHFTESNMPKSVRPDVALALFRITQESLHNALKHSGVREFTVRLRGTGTHIELVVSDNGAGFNVNEAIRGRGLGLISMRERIFALKGTLSIESQPMNGTRISVCVPNSVAASANLQ